LWVNGLMNDFIPCRKKEEKEIGVWSLREYCLGIQICYEAIRGVGWLEGIVERTFERKLKRHFSINLVTQMLVKHGEHSSEH